MTVSKKPKINGRTTGLIGLFGHTYVPDSENPDSGDLVMQYQFQIIREVKGDRYVVQLFSWGDGCPTEVVVMPEAELLGPSAKLYATADDWNRAADKQSERQADRWRWRREAKQEAKQNAKIA